MPLLRRLSSAAALAWLLSGAAAAATLPDPTPSFRDLVRRVPPDLDPVEPNARDPHAAAQQGIDWLVLALCQWMQTTGVSTDCTDLQSKTCMGCHVQAETVLGLARSADRCYSLPASPCSAPGDESPIEFAASFIAGAQRKDCILGPFSLGCLASGLVPVDATTIDGQPPELGSIGHYPPCGSNAPPASIHPMMQTTHGGLNLAGYTRHVSPRYAGNLVALASWLVKSQAPTGQWIPDRNEPPVDQGESFCTGAAVLAMRAAQPHAAPPEAATYDLAIANAVAWARTAPASSNQDKAFRLITYVEAGVPPSDPDFVAARADLQDDQFADGGWAERPGLQPNAYATGQAVHALIEAGLPLDDPTTCAGIAWLTDRQNADGSWSIGDPGITTDSSRRDNFTATIWPVLALGSLRPWGAALSLTDDHVLTCAEDVTFDVTITHAADTACGLFAQPDTYDVSAVNDSGDDVTVDTPVVDLAAGGSTTVTVRVRRVRALPPPGTLSSTTVRVDSRGARAAGCPVEATGTLVVETPSESVPGPVGFSLRVTREADDVVLQWDAATGDVARHEVVSVACPSPASCPTPPSRTVLDASTAVETVAGTPLSARRVDEAAPGSPGLVFYKVRGRGACFNERGPTCNFDCGGSAERCDALCP